MRTQIAVDVARGLAYMHAKKAGAIIHRDLKPGNLMVSGSMYHARCMPSHPSNPSPSSFASVHHTHWRFAALQANSM